MRPSLDSNASLRDSSRESHLQWQSCITLVRADALKRAAQHDVRQHNGLMLLMGGEQ